MQFLRVCLCLLMSFSVQAEISFEKMRGLQAKMKAEAEIFSPIYGFLALNTGTLERLRFFGNYGKIYKTQKDKAGVIQAPKMEGLLLEGVNPTWMHPSFLIHNWTIDKKTTPEQKKEIETQRKYDFDRQFEYPLDAISALVQWLFPSPDGSNFLPNRRSNDTVGDMYKGLTHSDFFAEKEKELANKKQELEPKVREQARINQEIKTHQDALDAKLKAVSGNKTIEELFQEKNKDATDKIKKIRAEDQPLITKLTKDKKALDAELETLHQTIERSIAISLPKLLKGIHAISADPDRTLTKFVAAVNKHLNDYPKSQGYIFLTIVYHALVQDGTFASTHAPIYPKHIALHAILGYFWAIANTKEEIVKVMTDAKLTREGIDLTHSYDQHLYEKIKSKIIGNKEVSFEERAYAGYGYEEYERRYPEIVGGGMATVPKIEGYPPVDPYSDCGETALRNFLNIMFSKTGGNFDVAIIPSSWPYHAQLQAFYSEFSRISDQKDDRSRNAWSATITTNLNKKLKPDANTDVQYRIPGNQDIKFSEIDSADWGMGNMLNVLGKLTGNHELIKPWKTHPGAPGFDEHKQDFYDQIATKLDALCKALSRDDFKVDWWFGQEGEKKLTSPHGDFVFTINGAKIFVFHVAPMHYSINPEYKESGDWRKDRAYPQELLQAFYAQNPSSAFLNPLIKSHSEKVIEFFEKDSGKLSSITFPLRLIYKLSSQLIIQDQHTREEFIKNMDALMKKHPHAIIDDFIETLLISRLKTEEEINGIFKNILENYPYIGKVFVPYIHTMNDILVKQGDQYLPVLQYIINAYPSLLDSKQKIEFITLLLRHGVNPNITIDDQIGGRMSILYHVLEHYYFNPDQKFEIIDLLLQHKADPNKIAKNPFISQPLIDKIIDEHSLNAAEKIKFVNLLCNYS